MKSKMSCVFLSFVFHSCKKAPNKLFSSKLQCEKKLHIFYFLDTHKWIKTFLFFFQANEDSISSYGKHLRIVSIVSLLQPLSMKKYFAVMVASVLTSNLWSKFEGSCDRQMYRILVRSFYSFTNFLLRCSQTTRHGRSE